MFKQRSTVDYGVPCSCTRKMQKGTATALISGQIRIAWSPRTTIKSREYPYPRRPQCFPWATKEGYKRQRSTCHSLQHWDSLYLTRDSQKSDPIFVSKPAGALHVYKSETSPLLNAKNQSHAQFNKRNIWENMCLSGNNHTEIIKGPDPINYQFSYIPLCSYATPQTQTDKTQIIPSILGPYPKHISSTLNFLKPTLSQSTPPPINHHHHIP